MQNCFAVALIAVLAQLPLSFQTAYAQFQADNAAHLLCDVAIRRIAGLPAVSKAGFVLSRQAFKMREQPRRIVNGLQCSVAWTTT